MRHQKVKILAFFLAVFIAVASFPALKSNAAVYNGSCGTDLTYTLNEDSGLLSIQGTGAMTDFPTSGGAPWASKRAKIKSISFSSSITHIGSNAFYGCTYITEVTIPNSVVSIGSSAFYGCTRLSSVTLSNNLTAIDSYTFKSCSGLTSISFPGSVKTINTQAFFGDKALKTVTFSNGLSEIGQFAFQNCTGLGNFTLPASLSYIGRSAFNGCTSITRLVIPENVTTIDKFAFCGCSGITTVTLPDDILKVDGSAFQDCSSLSSINIPNGILYIGEECFLDCISLSSFTIPSSVQSFGYSCFAGCTSLHQVTYTGTRSQWESIDTLMDGEWSMDQEFAEQGIEVIFSHGANELTITSNPSNVTGRVGNTATFSVRATGDGLTYQWNEFVDGEWVACTYTGSTTANLTVPITCNKDGRRYDCTVTDTYGLSKTSTSATLTIDRTNLMINSAPVNFTGLVGETATFTIAAQGDELAYQWQVFNDGNWKNATYEGAKTPNLSVAIMNSRDGFIFRCIVEDGYGNTIASNEVTLNVAPPLSIICGPSDYKGPKDSTATFSVEAEGDGLKYQWQVLNDNEWKNATFEGAQTASMSVVILSSRDGFKFRCVVDDAYGVTATSNEATLRVAPPVTIVTGPSDFTGLKDNTAIFTVEASGEGLSYQWQVLNDNEWKNATFEGAQTASMSVVIMTSRDGFKFRCVVEDAYGVTATSNEATLRVAQPVTIVTGPSDFTGLKNNTAVFSVEAEGDGLKYQWQVLNDNEWKNATFDGAQTASMSVVILSSRDGSKFRCVVEDAYGATATSNEATLKVAPPIIIVSEPSDYMGPKDDTAVFTVEAEGDGLKYQWQVLNENEWKNATFEGAQTASMSVLILTSRDGFKFRCLIEDAYGAYTTTNEVTLSLPPSLEIVSDPSDYTGPKGEVAVFSVEAVGYELNYQWQINKDGTWKNATFEGAQTSTMYVDIMTSRDGFKFRCIVEDALGESATSKAATLRLPAPISITANPSDYTGPKGDTAVFTVEAEGEGLTYQWQVNKDGTWRNATFDGAQTATLSVGIMSSRDGFKFRCVIEDIYGGTATSKAATLRLPAPISITANPSDYTGPKGDTAVFTVEAEGEGLTYQWQVYKDGSWKIASFSGSQTATLSVEIMTSRNGFKFRCIITDIYGGTATSNEAYLKVLSEPINSGFKNEIDLNEVYIPSNSVSVEPSEANDVVVTEIDYVDDTLVSEIDQIVTEPDIVEETIVETEFIAAESDIVEEVS